MIGCSPESIPIQDRISRVAPVLKTKLIHIGRTNNMTIIAFLLYLEFDKKYAIGYPINKHNTVLNKPINIETNKTDSFVVEVKKLTNACQEK